MFKSIKGEKHAQGGSYRSNIRLENWDQNWKKYNTRVTYNYSWIRKNNFYRLPTTHIINHFYVVIL